MDEDLESVIALGDLLDDLLEQPFADAAEVEEALKRLDEAVKRVVADRPDNPANVNPEVAIITTEQTDRLDDLGRKIDESGAVVPQRLRDFFARTVTAINPESTYAKSDEGQTSSEFADQAEAAGSGDGDLIAPRWFLDRYGYDFKTQEEADEFLRQINEALVEEGLQPVSSFDDIEDPGRESILGDIVSSIVGPPEEIDEPELEPEQLLKINLTYGNDYETTPAELDRMLSLTGMTQNQFTRTLQLVDAYGMRRLDQGKLTFNDPRLGGVSMSVNDGGSLAPAPAILLMNMTGHTATGGTAAERNAALRRARELKKEMDNLSNTPDAGNRYVLLKRSYHQAIREWRALAPGTERSSTEAPLTNLNLQGVFNRFAEGTEMYGGIETLGMFHAVDPALAASLWQSNGDVTKIAQEDFEKANYWLSKAVPGFGSGGDALSSALVQMGHGEAGDDSFVRDILGQVEAVRSGRAGAGGGGVTRMIPDRVALAAAAKDLIEALYPQEASDADIETVVQRVMAESAGAADDQTISLEARVRKAVEDLPQFSEFYGNKPGGVSTGEYRAIMEAGERSMLGNEAGLTGAAGLGMRTGEYQTSVGAAMGTSAAFDNSTFLGRLARAAQVTSLNT